MWKNKPEEKKKPEKKGNPINLDEIFGSEFHPQNINANTNQNNRIDTDVVDSRNLNQKAMKSPKYIDESNESIDRNHVEVIEKKNGVEKSNSIGTNNKTINPLKKINDSNDIIVHNNALFTRQKNGVQKSESSELKNNAVIPSKMIDYSDDSIKIDKETNAKIIRNINNLFLISEYAMCFQECKKYLDENTALFCTLLKVDSCKNFQALIGKLKSLNETPGAVGLSVVKFLSGLSRFITLSDEAILNNNDALINFIDRIKQLNKYILAVAKKNQESKIKRTQTLSESRSNEIAIKTKRIQYGGQIYPDSVSINNRESNVSIVSNSDSLNKSEQKAVIDVEIEEIRESIPYANEKNEIKENIDQAPNSDHRLRMKKEIESKLNTSTEIDSQIDVGATEESNIHLSQSFSSDINPEAELLDFIENDEIMEESQCASSTDESLSDFPFGFYLNYFDAVRGPKTFYDLSIAPDPSITDEMLDTMNKNHGYYVLEVNHFIIYSFLFEIPSEISRGKIDLLQYAVCVNSNLFDVKNGDFSQNIRKYFMKASQFFQNNKDIYLGLWYGREDSRPDIDKQKIQSEYMKILRITSELEAKVLSILNAKKNTTKSFDILEHEEFKKNYMKKLTEVLDLIEIFSKS